MLQYATLNGFLPAIKAQVVQSRHVSLDGMLDSAKRAEVGQQAMRGTEQGILQAILKETLKNRKLTLENQRAVTQTLTANNQQAPPHRRQPMNYTGQQYSTRRGMQSQ
jgi:glycine betaine/choline ABC-type transport system substrate-binding protein